VKGLILSTAVFVLYVFGTALICHVCKVKRHAKLFVPALVFGELLFLLSYGSTPSDLWFLRTAWQANFPWLDVILGAFILFLNIHSYVDWFFGFNGGFSTSLMMLLLLNQTEGVATESLVSKYRGANGADKIYGWRIPRLEETGYMLINQQTHACTLTGKGRVVATLSQLIKKIFNLGPGG